MQASICTLLLYHNKYSYKFASQRLPYIANKDHSHIRTVNLPWQAEYINRNHDVYMNKTYDNIHYTYSSWCWVLRMHKH